MLSFFIDENVIIDNIVFMIIKIEVQVLFSGEVRDIVS